MNTRMTRENIDYVIHPVGYVHEKATYSDIMPSGDNRSEIKSLSNPVPPYKR